MLCFKSLSARSARAEAKKRGKKSEFKYLNTDGNRVHFEFVGVLDLLDLGLECGPDEVWHNIVELVRPMERRGKLIPRTNQLTALQFGAKGRSRLLRQQPARRRVARGA